MRALAAALSVLSLLSCAPALAQAPGALVAAVTPPGMHLVDVDVPDVDRVPVRLRFAPAPQARAEVLVDVLVGDDAPSAAEAAAWFRETVSGELPELGGIGDAAVGDAGLVAFVRGEVFVIVRRVAGGQDPVAIARAIDRSLRERRASPPSGVTVDVPAVPVGETRPIARGDALAMHVTASGPGEARRTRQGWTLTRTAQGAIELHVVVVDRALRRHVRRVTVR